MVDVRKTGAVTFKKVDETGAKLDGATFTLSKDGEPVGKAFVITSQMEETVLSGEVKLSVSADGTATISGLGWGSYVLTETAAPENYETPAGDAAKHAFTISQDTFKETEGMIELGDIVNKKLVTLNVEKTWNDADNHVERRPESIRVRLYADGVELEDQVAIVKPDDDGKWKYKFEDLPAYKNGKEINYTISEDPVPGYLSDVKQNEDGTYTITNTITSIKVSKVDITDQKELENAELQIIEIVDGEEKVIESWTSGKTPHEITGLETGKQYILRETVAPNGYTLTTDKTFELKEENGQVKVDTEKSEAPVSKEGILLVEDEVTSVKIRKVDITNDKELPGAHIQIWEKTSEGEKLVTEWDSTKEDKVVEKLKTNTTYILRETVAPDGYTITTDTTFELDEHGKLKEDKTTTNTKDGVLLVEDARTVEVSKVDLGTGEELDGAHIQVLDKAGNVVDEWDSKKGETHKVKNLTVGQEYTLRETVAPDGYTLTTDTTFTIDRTGKVTGTVTINKDGVLLVEDTATSVKVRKVDITNDKELPGAHIQIWEKTGEGEKLVTEWDSTKEDKVVEKLKTNTTYILRETVAPDGYTITTDTAFELDEHGKLKKDKTTTNIRDGVLLVEDARTVEVSKVDLGTGEELDGAHIQVLDKAGNVVDEWDSKKGETHKVKNLTVGQEYTLRETVAPNGYTLTTDTTFTVDRTGKVTGTVTINKDGVLLVEDTATKAEITKLDAATEAPLSGAVLRVIDANGTAVDEWTTDGQPHVIEAKLNTGATYQLIEVKAPDGYEIADPISFTMKADGTTDPVVMKDAMTRSEKASVSVTKKLTFSGEEISAVDATFYVALYADEACTKRISEIMPLVFKKASSATVTFTNVEIGRTYYVGECDANGVNFVSGVMAGNVAYAAIFANGNKATVTETDGTATVYFENQFATIPDGFYKEGILTITKKLLGSDKKAKNSNEVFYAGIFSDAAYTQLSGDVSENIVALDLAGGSEAEAEVFVAIAPGGSQTLYVTEVDANGKPVAGAAGFKYTVQVDKTSVTLSEANTEAHVTITNTETETETESETKKTTSVKTGDDTPIAPYMALMFASMAMLAAEIHLQTQKTQRKIKL